MTDRFKYNKGDIKIGRSQCEFCKFCIETDESVAKYCEKYPEGKPSSLINGSNWCRLFAIKK